MISVVGRERLQLAAQLRTDRAAGAGDQHASSGDVVGDRRCVDVRRVAAEEIGDRHRPDVGRPHVTEQLADRRQHQHPQTCVQQWRGEHAQLLAGDRRDGHQHRVGAEPCRHVERVRTPAAHAQPVELHAG